MSRPITWQNIGQPAPSFDNTGFGVAGDAFGGVSKGARLLAEAFYKRQAEQDVEAQYAATNAALKQGLAKGVYTPQDYAQLGADVDVSSLDAAMQTQGTFQQNILTGQSQVRQNDAATDHSIAQTKQIPLDYGLEQTRTANDTSLTNAQIAEAQSAQARNNSQKILTDLAYSTDLAERDRGIALIQNSQNFQKYVDGNFGPSIDPATGQETRGSLNYELEQEFERNLAAEELKAYNPNTDFGPPAPLFSPEKKQANKDQFIKMRREEILQNPDLLLQKGLDFNLVGSDVLLHTPAGQQVQRLIEGHEQTALTLDKERQQKLEKTKEFVEAASNGNRGVVIYGGESNGFTFRKSENLIGSEKEAKSILETIGIDSDHPIVPDLLKKFPDAQSLQIAAKEMAIEESFFGGKLQFPDDIDEAQSHLNSIYDASSAALTKAKEGVGEAQFVGTAADALKTSIQAAVSGGKNEKPKVSSDLPPELATKVTSGQASNAEIRDELKDSPEKVEKAITNNIENLDTNLKEISNRIKTSIPTTVSKLSTEYDQLQEYLRKFTDRQTVARVEKMGGDRFEVPAQPYKLETLQKDVEDFEVLWSRIITADTDAKRRESNSAQIKADALRIQSMSKQ